MATKSRQARQAEIALEGIHNMNRLRKEREAHELRYHSIIDSCATSAIAALRLSGRYLDYRPMTLWYRTGELLLTADEQPAGFISSGHVMPITVPYAQVYKWVRDHSSSLSIF